MRVSASGVLRGTPFHERTGPLCQTANWRRWAGHLAAGSYEPTHEHEYQAIRSAAALIDVSPLYKYRLAGPGAEALANRVVTRDVARQAVGQVYYTPWCDGAGKVRDDGTLQRFGETDFRLTSAEPTLKWLHENARGLDVELEEETERVGALALQGPLSRDLLQRITDADVAGLRYFRVMTARVAGIRAEISRTGYTGDLGYEIWVDAEDAIPLWDALTAAGEPFGLAPAGLLALDMARLEAGLLLVDVDYVPAQRAIIEDQKSSPYELGLGWAVAMEASNFVGRAALRAERAHSPAWRFRGITLDWESLEDAYAEVRLPPQLPGMTLRESVPLYAGGRQVGYATSRGWSPTLKTYLGLAHLRADFADIGTQLQIEVTVEHQRRRARATVARTPFFDPDRKRANP
ncbi:aminomethyltransferase family protein [Candidatus Palauibacter sp.]|uniref:aminomethyltransferase family protein n=1 Tax=Candidatus Palauibacter sp. TaxID=3101350 RepID=UPI003B0132BD